MKSYKTVERKADLSSCVSDAYSEIASLAEEMSEAIQRILVSEAKDTLDGKDEPEVPDILDGIEVSWSEQIPKDKRHKSARWARLSNVCAMLGAAAEAVREASSNHGMEGPDAATYVETFKAAQDELADALEETVGEIEGVEFPTMFG